MYFFILRYGKLYFTLSKIVKMSTTKKAEEVEIDVRDLILTHLETEERDLAWLQRKTLIPYATLYSCFIQKLFKVKDENLDKINDVLGTNFKG